MLKTNPTIQRYTPLNPCPAIRTLTPCEARLLIYITDAGRVDASCEAIAEVLACSKATVRASLSSLAEKNIISLKHMGYDCSQKLYRMERAILDLTTCVWDEETGWVVAGWDEGKE